MGSYYLAGVDPHFPWNARTVKDKARANLEAAQILIERSLLDPAMSRLYYALFQAGVHVLEGRGDTPATHTAGITN